MKPLSEVLSSILKKVVHDPLIFIYENWSDIIGDELYSEAVPKHVIKKRLTVICSSSVVIQELKLRKKLIINKINDRYGSEIIEDIFFKQ